MDYLGSGTFLKAENTMTILVRLIYASKVAPNFGPMDMREILQKSRHNNIESGITGLLVMSDGYFFQALEGDRMAVHTTYAKIMRDARHSRSVVLSASEIEKRHFTDWSMGYVLSTEKNRPLFMSYSADKYFEPLSMRAQAAESLLVEIGQHARQIGGTESLT
ncbi:MAG: blue light sensor protein [Comamonadaceae bacterium CG_4_9_14_0_8_um_filter_57_21]|nr:MAG: blue light sensor protein [Comamonadaceae bacterium CG_4_10_14_0_8_um_filter_57_29]PJC20738.1 MAG: blue light sensor protein [Comamonadaceae bacterium CG_4_9_14_0_8_um_filter_57_21]